MNIGFPRLTQKKKKEGNTSLESSLFLSLVLPQDFFYRFALLLSSPSFYSYLSSASCPALSWIQRVTCPISTSSCHLLIIQIKFWGVSIIQASHLVFNMADIKQEELINAEMIVILGFASPSCFSGMTSVEVSLIKHLAVPQVDYVSSGRMIPRITPAMGLVDPPPL